MSYDDADHEIYRAYVNDVTNRLLSTEIALDAGLVISTRQQIDNPSPPPIQPAAVIRSVAI